uniref:Uncharacterized protein n=1 Tax=Rhizophagus irregularis (strain DAOM 181602 / DAOM 197198 / MUCL 43194) TaxID=747089 RepID=U9UG48_RHIID
MLHEYFEPIANQEEGGRHDKAQRELIARDPLRFFVIGGIEAQVILRDRLLFKTKSQLGTGPVGVQMILRDRLTFKEPKPDYKIARRWEEEHVNVNRQIHLYNPTLVKVNNGIGTIGNIETVNGFSAGSKKEVPYLQSDDDDFQPAISTTQKRKNLSLKRDKKSNVPAKKVKATNRDEENLDLFFNSNKAKGSTSSDFLKNMASSSSQYLEMTNGTSEVNSSRPYTLPHQIQSAPRNQDLITPHKPTLYEHTAKYLSKHFSMSINQDCVIMKANQVVTIPSEIRHWLIDSFSSEKDKFKSSIITSFNPDHPFRKICEIILYDFFSMSSEATLNRDIGERKYTFIKDVKSVFPEFDFTLSKVDGIGFKTGSNKELVFIEISGGPESPVEKHVKEDTEKLIKEAMFGLISLLRDYLDKNAEYARNICTYMVQGIGDRITLSKLQLDQKHFYKVLQIKLAKLPFSFDEVEKYLEVFELLYALISELKNTQKELKKLTCSNSAVDQPTVRSWLWVLNNIATWEGVGITYEG